MQKEVHGHEVLSLIVNAHQPVTLPELRAEIGRKYGQEARFYTCSARGMDLDQLLRFLEEKKKIWKSEDSLHPGSSPMCNH